MQMWEHVRWSTWRTVQKVNYEIQSEADTAGPSAPLPDALDTAMKTGGLELGTQKGGGLQSPFSPHFAPAPFPGWTLTVLFLRPYAPVGLAPAVEQRVSGYVLCCSEELRTAEKCRSQAGSRDRVYDLSLECPEKHSNHNRRHWILPVPTAQNQFHSLSPMTQGSSVTALGLIIVRK
ncbi:hypothetical protein E5288_WYG004187 [Bos mutus]|uniref:Uncharacterized protein n=1 Tax=Bos mutus TaxID=72004 RepID=A0A6B0R7Y6_9CETA|nr:hypothetical protein [Bos mutus]